VLDGAARGVAFGEVAVFLRSPRHYLGLLEHACARGDVPVYFDHGTSRPDPAGRAFVALLSCAVDGLSAKRFDEYLSLGQVPPVSERRSADSSRSQSVVPPRDEVFHFDAPPIVEELAGWPDRATWGEWLDAFMPLAGRVLRRPTRVLQTLADLRPMAEVGPVTLEEARDVLHDRLVPLDWDPPARRYGRVFVGTPHQARGRTFRLVFVPGLAERGVPQLPREDPLLLDGGRATAG